jgi:excisionase family DNA binding protein
MARVEEHIRVSRSPIAVAAVSYEPLLTKEDVAERLKVNPSTIYELTRRRTQVGLPYYKVGKYIRFRWSEVEAWLNGCRRSR